MVVFAVVALILANIPYTSHWYHQILTTKFNVGFEGFMISKSVEEWVNDGLMSLFFFVVGLEIKREIVAGQLSSLRQASLPIAAAVGGMVVPALIFFALNHGTPYSEGWGIPMATDIAFAIGVLSLLGDRVPLSMKIFLTALAIVDDLGAILVIAIFYTSQIDFMMLGCAGLVFAFLLLLNRLNVYKMRYYMVPSVVLWLLFLHSGVHATISGVLIAMTLATSPRFTKKYFIYKTGHLLEEFKFHNRENIEVISNGEQREALESISYIASGTISPLQRLEHNLHNVVTFFIMPMFALVNAGVTLGSVDDLHIFSNTQGAGIFLGLVAGKPIGIFLVSWLAVKLGWSLMPRGTTWRTLLGVACLGGIGFTMSIFIDNLAFAGTGFVDAGKIAVLIASVSAALLGALVLNFSSRGAHK